MNHSIKETMTNRITYSRTIFRSGLLAGVLAIAGASDAFAQSSSLLLRKPWLNEKEVLDAQANSFFLMDATTGAGEDIQLNVYETSGRVRLDPGNKAQPRLGFETVYFDIDTRDTRLPDHASDSSIAIGSGLYQKDGWTAGGLVGFGYSGVGAFDDGNAWYGIAAFLIEKEIDSTSGIGFILDYDGNRSILPDVPLPGVQYRKQVDNTLLLKLGVPFSSVAWQPTDRLYVEAGYFIPDNFYVIAEYKFAETLSVFGQYAQRTESFHWDELPNEHDRLFYEHTRVEGGVKWEAFKGAKILAGGGYVFGQEFNVGFDTREEDRLSTVADGAYLRFGIELNF